MNHPEISSDEYGHGLALWLLIILLVIIDTVWLDDQGMSVASGVMMPTLLPIAVTAGLAFFYTSVRRDMRIASLCHMMALTLAFTAVTMVMSYLMVALDRPLVDPALIAADRALGLDWPMMYQWVADKLWLYIGLKIIYLSLVPQFIALQLILNFQKRFRRVWELQWLFVLICLGCILVSGFWPAAGAFGAFHIQMDEPYVREFMALRAHDLKVVGVGGVQGVIQSPSLHTALAILYIYTARNIRFLFPCFLILNLLVIASTPAIGGHHFADVWGGAALALVMIGLSRLLAFGRKAPAQT